MNACKAVMELTRIGFRFRLKGEGVKVRFVGQETPDLSPVAPLLAVVKEHRDAVRRFLIEKKPSPPEHSPLVTIATGKKAQNLKEMGEHLLNIHLRSVYRHFWGGPPMGGGGMDGMY